MLHCVVDGIGTGVLKSLTFTQGHLAISNSPLLNFEHLPTIHLHVISREIQHSKNESLNKEFDT